jgi:SAM-dependent methyltransferase
MKKLKNCQICGNKLEFIFSLGKQPLCDDLVAIDKKKKNKVKVYDCDILYCKKCIIAYNNTQIIPKKLFPKSYHYRSKLTKDVLDGMKNLVNSIKKKYKNIKKKTVLDIGCNDGSLLAYFKKEKCITIGIDPTDAVKEAQIKYKYQGFFNKKNSDKIKKKHKNIDFITFTNVFAHINNLDQLLISLKNIINENTVIVIENHYLGSVISKKQFDTFYHEHPRTYSLNSLKIIATKLNLNIEKFEFPKRYGGNIRVFMSKNKQAKKLDHYIHIEKKYYNKLKKFQEIINEWKFITLKKIKEARKKNLIVGKAFPGRASILINILNLKKRHVSMIFEKENSMKIGYCVPNTDIPIVSDRLLNKIDKKTIIINFAWHIKKEIKKYLKNKGLKNKIIDII